MSYLIALTFAAMAFARPCTGHDLEGVLWTVLSGVFMLLGVLVDTKGKGP